MRAPCGWCCPGDTLAFPQPRQVRRRVNASADQTLYRAASDPHQCPCSSTPAAHPYKCSRRTSRSRPARKHPAPHTEVPPLRLASAPSNTGDTHCREQVAMPHRQSQPTPPQTRRTSPAHHPPKNLLSQFLEPQRTAPTGHLPNSANSRTLGGALHRRRVADQDLGEHQPETSVRTHPKHASSGYTRSHRPPSPAARESSAPPPPRAHNSQLRIPRSFPALEYSRMSGRIAGLEAHWADLSKARTADKHRDRLVLAPTEHQHRPHTPSWIQFLECSSAPMQLENLPSMCLIHRDHSRGTLRSWHTRPSVAESDPGMDRSSNRPL